MKRFLRWVAVWLILSAVTAFAVAWAVLGLRHWLAIQTGIDYCVNLPIRYQVVCQRYGFWSGFGSVFPWSLGILGAVWGGLLMHWRHINCQAPGCPLIGHYPDSRGVKWCARHHPDHQGQEHITMEFLHRLHHEHVARMRGPGGD